MTNKIYILGKRAIPIWLIVLVLVACGAGAATGTVLVGKVTAEVPVAVSQALLVSEPLFEQIKHTPNEAREDVDANIPPTEAYASLDTVLSDYSALAFSDDVREDTIGAGTGNRPEQAFKFYVGPEANISQIVINWEGNGSASQVDGLKVYDDTIAAPNWANPDAAYDNDIPAGAPSETSKTFTFTSATDPTVADIVDSNGYVYLLAYLTAMNNNIYTDYVSATVTYTAIDWDNWTGYTGPQNTEHIYTTPNRFVGVVSDDNTAFQAAVEIAVGDWYLIMVPLKNASENDLVAELVLYFPDCLEVEVVSADQVDEADPRVVNAIRTGLYTWKLIVEGAADMQDDDDYLYIAVNADDHCLPGFYTISGTFNQIPY